MDARSSEAAPSRAADLAACRALLRSGSRSFHLASLLLPRRVGAAATALYAFCRLADDAIDLEGSEGAAVLASLQAQLDRVYAGMPAAQPMERLLATVVHEYAIPRTLLAALLEGFEWDAAGRRYPTLAALYAYAARVAGSVGATMTLLMGVRHHDVLARACDLGVAMQLTNIARDVGQDARAGRLYLPLDWLREAGIDPEAWLAQPVYSAALGHVIERLLVAADQLYERSAGGIGGLPADCRPGIHAARLLYAEIGNDLRRHGLDAVARRAHVARRAKAWLMCSALYAATRPADAAAHAPLEETRFLVSAVGPLPAGADAAGTAVAGADGARAPQQGRAEWLLELFERLQERDQLSSAAEGSAR
jgi:15-cis-phytoene synthase